MTDAIIVQNLSMAYDNELVLNDINLNVPSGVKVAIVGPNGAGKSTLMKGLMNLLKPVNGQISFPTLDDKVKNKISYVPQSSTVDWDFPATVLDVVTMGRYGYLARFQLPGKKEKAIALQCLEQVQMTEYANVLIGNLSGGQKQRVFLARALAQEGEIYILDEPLKGVDATTQVIVMECLDELKKRGKTMVVVHHDLNTVKKYFDYVALINKELIDFGPVEEVFCKHNVEKTFGGMVTI